jgi:hypothetical protein
MLDVPGGHWEGLEGLGATVLAELHPGAERQVRKAALQFSNAIKLTLTGKRHGRTYKVSKRGPLHVASAPGEPPAVLFDNLRASVGYSEPVWGVQGENLTVSCEVGVGLGQAKGLAIDPSRTYARRLELGGIDKHGVMIEARPYIAPTEDRMRATLDATLEIL